MIINEQMNKNYKFTLVKTDTVEKLIKEIVNQFLSDNPHLDNPEIYMQNIINNYKLFSGPIMIDNNNSTISEIVDLQGEQEDDDPLLRLLFQRPGQGQGGGKKKKKKSQSNRKKKSQNNRKKKSQNNRKKKSQGNRKKKSQSNRKKKSKKKK